MTRRGLSLLEVMLAAALLALITATCLPAVVRAAAALDTGDAEPTVSRAELARLADALIEAPAAFGLETLPTSDVFEVAWPEAPGRPLVSARRHRAASTIDDGRAWLVLTCGDATVCRWLPPPETSDEEPVP